MTAPALSVVVGAYQAAARLRASLHSVLAQSFRDLELIVVDDGSTDATPALLRDLIASDPRVRVLSQANQGLTAALTRGCAEARGEFIARHDCDDVSLEGRFERQVELLRDRPSAAFVSSWSRVIGPGDELLYEIQRPGDPHTATQALLESRDGPAGHGSVMFRADAYRQAGGYRAAFRYAQDWDLWLRLAERGRLAYVPEYLYAFRVDVSSISALRRSQQMRLAELARRCAAARRSGQPEGPWLEQAARVSAEPAPARSERDPGNSYFIGKCLLDRRDPRCVAYLRQALRERPASWRAWAALLLAQPLRRPGVRQTLGALVHDVPRLAWALRPGPRGARAPWLAMRNRRERLAVASDGRGVRCEWRWTSDLHVARVFPGLGLALMRRALAEWPIAFAEAPPPAEPPEVSFLIGHRGLERLPLLLGVLRSIAAQQGAAVECVVVEQSRQRQIEGRLPGWVRYVHTPPPDEGMPYARAWAFNVAARAARAPLLVFHDGDILVPQAYARELLEVHRAGSELIDLKRFLFELNPEQTGRALGGSLAALAGPLERILQNAQGGTLAADRDAFLQIGGFDESFVGWGGEDNEFWERAALRRVHAFGWLPFVHLWHASQPGKADPTAATLRRYRELSAVPAEQRIAALRARPGGQAHGPAVAE